MEWLTQNKLLLRKNWIFSVRNPTIVGTQVGATAMFMLLLMVLRILNNTSHPIDESTLFTQLDDPIPHCQGWNGKQCVTMMYTPMGHALVDSLMTRLAAENDMVLGTAPITPDTDVSEGAAALPDIIPMGDKDDITGFVTKQPNVTDIAIIFEPTGPAEWGPDMKYTLYYNQSCGKIYDPNIRGYVSTCPNDIRQWVQRSVDRLMIQDAVRAEPTYSSVTLDLKVRRHLLQTAFKLGDNDTDVVGGSGIVFNYCGLMINWMVLLYSIVQEKEARIRSGLWVMGLKDSVYWSSWLITNFIISFLSLSMLILFGTGIDFFFFTQTDLGVLILFFSAFALAMISWMFFLSIFFSTARQSLNGGIMIFVTGNVLILLFGMTTLYQVYGEHSSLMWRGLLQLIPLFNFAKFSTDVFFHSFIPKPPFHDVSVRFTMNDLFVPANVQGLDYPSPPPIESILFLFGNFVLYSLLTWYCDAVFSDGDHGPAKKWNFFATKKYWGLDKASRERRKMRSLVEIVNSFPGDRAPVILDSLHKSYRMGAFGRPSAKDVVGVRNLRLEINESNLYCLLGHNGAGKTTTINLMNGLLGADKGTVDMYGLSSDDNELLRRMMGVCPQHDILWQDLTSREHLQIFAELKRVPKSKIKAMIDEKLSQVELLKVGDNRVSSYSGGMKRRLSVAIAMMGNPQIVLLDEPTTGMDPLNKRKVWEVVRNLKQGRICVFTTHSMEEAEFVGDTIVIYGDGYVAAQGTALYLKNEFGSGYHLHVEVPRQQTAEFRSVLFHTIPEASLASEIKGTLSFKVPFEQQPALIAALEMLEANAVKNDVRRPKKWKLKRSGSMRRRKNFMDTLTGGNVGGSGAGSSGSRRGSRGSRRGSSKAATASGSAAGGDPTVFNGIVLDWSISHTTLEDVFLAVTRQAKAEGRNGVVTGSSRRKKRPETQDKGKGGVWSRIGGGSTRSKRRVPSSMRSASHVSAATDQRSASTRSVGSRASRASRASAGSRGSGRRKQ